MSIVKEVDKNNMWDEIYLQALDIITRFFDKGILILSFIFGVFLSQIGYPKEIVVFILVLSIVDILTKHISIVITNYSSLNFSNYFKAWQEKKLTSRQLKNGISVKVILYAILMYISNQLCVVDGILFGKEISGVIYSAIVFVEVSSVLENGIAMGGSGLIPVRDFIKNKYKQILGLDKNK